MAADASAPTFATRFKRPTFIGGLGVIFVFLLFLLLIKEATVSPSQFAQTTLIGLTNGAVYALIALGYTLVYGILGNFTINATGDTNLTPITIYKQSGKNLNPVKTLVPSASLIGG